MNLDKLPMAQEAVAHSKFSTQLNRIQYYAGDEK